jgi:hypothetical protein
MSAEKNPQRYFSNGIISLIPALYALQLYGWLLAALIYLLTLFSLAALSWAVVIESISPRAAGFVRVAFVLIIMLGLGVSGTNLVTKI